MMNQLREMNGARILVWTIVGFFVTVANVTAPNDASTIPTDASSSPLDTLGFNRQIVSVPGAAAVVPQVGYLEETEKDVTIPIMIGEATESTAAEGIGMNYENSAHGVLVPVVSVVDSSKNNPNGNPLVALLPVSVPVTTTPADESVAYYDQAQSIEPQTQRRFNRIQRSIDDRTGEDRTSEIMDVAEDIVFRPLFRIRQDAVGRDPYQRNNQRNYYKSRGNYRRYNANGYYRSPSDY